MQQYGGGCGGCACENSGNDGQIIALLYQIMNIVGTTTTTTRAPYYYAPG